MKNIALKGSGKMNQIEMLWANLGRLFVQKTNIESQINATHGKIAQLEQQNQLAKAEVKKKAEVEKKENQK